MKSTLEFRKQRQLGEILSDSFAFWRIHYSTLKPLMIKKLLVPLLIAVFAGTYYQYHALNLSFGNFGLPLFSGMTLSILGVSIYYSFAAALIFNYMKTSMEEKDTMNFDLLSEKVNKDFTKLLLLSFLSFIILMVAFVLFVIPGIYVMIPLSLSFPLLVFQKTSIGEALSQSFKLVSGHWWTTFGTVLVLGLVIGFISYAFQIPAVFYIGIKAFWQTVENDGVGFMSGVDIIYILLTAIASTATYLLYLFLLTGMALIYFDLDEIKNKTGLKEKIDQL